jgi:hypothetical protein
MLPENYKIYAPIENFLVLGYFLPDTIFLTDEQKYS